jgi:hypothetical protein
MGSQSKLAPCLYEVRVPIVCSIHRVIDEDTNVRCGVIKLCFWTACFRFNHFVAEIWKCRRAEAVFQPVATVGPTEAAAILATGLQLNALSGNIAYRSESQFF